MILHTGRFQLRPLCAADAEWIARDIANPKVQCWLTSPPHPYTLGDAQWFIQTFADNPGFRVVKEAGQPVGIVSIESAIKFDATRADAPELGYWLAQRGWGRGVMTEAAAALIDWFFETRDGGIGSGWIRGNTASQNVLTKLGFIPTGAVLIRRANFLGKDVPIDRVSLTKEQWQRRKPA